MWLLEYLHLKLNTFMSNVVILTIYSKIFNQTFLLKNIINQTNFFLEKQTN